MPLRRSSALTNRARGLRQIATDAEKHLWEYIRDRRFGGIKFARQRPIGPYIADFYCPEHSLVIELDGAAHASGDQKAYDEERSAYLVGCGLKVLRFTNDEVLGGVPRVLEAIRQVLGPHP